MAIASAITAYARIEMIKFKTIPDLKVYYTDTDSIFVDKELPAELVGSEIGQMKDELDGGWIKKAYFLGIKKYAFFDNHNKLKTVFSGLIRNSLTWEDILTLVDNKPVVKKIPDQFFKSLSRLEISIKHKMVEVKFNSGKKLIGNVYQHIYIEDFNSNLFNKLLKGVISKITKFLAKYRGNLK